MKNQKSISKILMVISIFVVACRKEAQQFQTIATKQPRDMKDTGSAKTDTMTGKEFTFEDLTWTHAGPGAIAEEELWIGLDNRSDLFNNPQRPLEVSIKFDTSADWLTVPKWDDATTPSNIGFVYLMMHGNSFYVESFPMNFLLIDRKASLKIKFL